MLFNPAATRELIVFCVLSTQKKKAAILMFGRVPAENKVGVKKPEQDR